MSATSANSDLKRFSREEFLEVFDRLQNEIIEEIGSKYEMPEEARNWIREMMNYNVPGGKLNRGLTVVHAMQAIRGNAISQKETEEAAVLGWGVEWLQAFFLVADDVMDNSHTRRGQECWYRKKNVGLVAINDSFLLQSGIFILLKRYFGDRPFYGQLLELFNETTLQTELGQLMDLTSNPMDGPTDLDRFTIQRHHLIVKYKTAFYSFYLPVALAMTLAGIATEKSLTTARDILVDMGVYFQVQDDFLDCYADPKILGKVGTDIQDNKCSWLVVQALERANDEQKQQIKESYGIDEPKEIEKVKQLFKDLKLEEVYHQYEADMYDSLTKRIAALEADSEIKIPGSVFTDLLKKIYKRQK